jgi:signal transduction histidine kinase
MNVLNTAHPKGNILVVDDLPENLRLLVDILQKQGYEVRPVPNGKLALSGARGFLPDLILLDIMMPEMDGYEVCSQLKAEERTKNIPIIFISAINEVLDKVKAFQVGGVDYITKPFQVEEVVARVETHLAVQRLQKSLQYKNDKLAQTNNKLVKANQELKKSNNDLVETLQQLKATQEELIQSKKMAALGHLIAGIAHEINNPISFIYGNIHIARGYFKDLLRLVKLYEQTSPHPLPEIQQLAQELDLDFLVEDWQKLMDSMQVGAERISEIVRSLQSFSRLDETGLKAVDIHEVIDNTLLLLQHRMRAEGDRREIQVIKNYGQLPLVACYVSQLNQVFMNLLSNAIDALENQTSPGIITISTSLSQPSKIPSQKECVSYSRSSFDTQCSQKETELIFNSQFVVIRIADNGSGMDEAVKNHIFDPFFTTKAVGHGPGLGLSISYQIVVEKHLGQISCISAPGQGTEFIVEIPLYLTDKLVIPNPG